MINDYFKQKNPFCYNYFSNLLEQVRENKRNFPQAIIFEGSNTKIQYYFSLELAIALNNIINNNPTNEKWIKSYAHPAINLISQIHGKPDDDTTKTVISTKQAKNIESSLKLTSDYYRFFIFFSSSEHTYNDEQLIEYKNIGYNTDIDFSIEPLKYDTFNVAAANTLLKSVEEPPKNTTFIFLTESKENILPTIASRCQLFKLSSNNYAKNCFASNEISSIYENISIQNAYQMADNIINISKNSQTETTQILNELNLHIKNLITQNPNYSTKLLFDIKVINQAIKMIKANVNEKLAIETMLFRIVRGY